MVNCALRTDGRGFQVFNAVNDEITVDEKEGTTEEWLKKVCPDTVITRKVGEREAPVSNEKIRDMLGFKEEYPWRNVIGRKI
jgi:hypothetical protein